ncbi:MAG: Ldh family oxidoreductase [Proteobacteria bacterium]|nr:Ldh family oxidoreductase [Pseudomonadota bacterium]
MSTTETIPPADLERLIARAIAAAGTSEPNAASVARALTAAEIDGQKGHGVSRVASYAAQVRAGKIDGHATPSAKRTRPATLAIDAAHGFAYPALDLAIAGLPAMARDCGIAAAGITRSHHAGALGLVAERLAEQSLVALVFANTPSAMAAWGGTKPVFGTNPVAFAAPRADAPPLVIDMALSEVARGKIVTAAASNEPIPLGWATDSSGKPTTDAKAALAGTLLPAGGAKGAALALMVELLAAAVTGSHFAGEASSFLDAAGPPPATGQLVIAIDAATLGASGSFASRLAALASEIEAEPGVRLPGARRHALREKARRDGVAIEARQLAALRASAT